MNIPLIIFDLIIFPLTIIRIIIIYFCGSKYNVPKCTFFDVLMHANKPYFNQNSDVPTIDIINTDIRTIIKDDTRIYNKQITTEKENVVIGDTEKEMKRFVDDALTELTEAST